MQFSLEASQGIRIVAYAEGEVTISRAPPGAPPGAGTEVLRGSTIILPESVVPHWPPQCPEDLRPEHLEPVLALGPEVILLGVGARMTAPDPGLIARANAARVGLEIMDTGAACRTYNILAAEGRRVAAALLMVGAVPT